MKFESYKAEILIIIIVKGFANVKKLKLLFQLQL